MFSIQDDDDDEEEESEKPSKKAAKPSPAAKQVSIPSINSPLSFSLNFQTKTAAKPSATKDDEDDVSSSIALANLILSFLRT